MKRIISLVLATILCAGMLCACGQSNETTNVSLYDLSRVMLDATEFGDMTYVSSADDGAGDLFTYISDLEYEKVAQFFLAYATDGKGNADEIAVVQVKNKLDLDAAVKSLQAHLEKRVNLYRTYDPTQSAKIEKGEVFTVNDLAVLIVSENNAAVKSACLSALENANLDQGEVIIADDLDAVGKSN